MGSEVEQGWGERREVDRGLTGPLGEVFIGD